MTKNIGALLVNLGTPTTPYPKDVFHYLNEFLTDERVIQLPWWKRQCLVRAVIVPFRFLSSSKMYQRIWMKEGSPLLVFGRKCQSLLQETLGTSFHVELAMRYQKPSIQEGLENLLKKEVESLIILPLFPQYASATVGSIYQKVMEIVERWQHFPNLHFINSFPTHPLMIEAYSLQAEKKLCKEKYDHILFSFHGLPKKHLEGACSFQQECCQSLTSKNGFCYSAQCYSTAFAIAKRLEISKEDYSISFQSRLGKDPWLEPFTLDVLNQLVEKGKRKVLVFCPSFVSDCLETLYEIAIEYNQEFIKRGGHKLDLVEGLNDHPLWIQTLKDLILSKVSKSECLKPL